MQYKGFHPEKQAAFFSDLNSWIEKYHPIVSTVFVDLGVSTVRIVCRHEDFLPLIEKQLTYTICDNPEKYDATLVIWKLAENEPAIADNGKGLRIFYESDDRTNTHYYAASNLEPEIFVLEGHIFVQMFNRITKSPNTNLAHGAVVGIDGFGALICARGQRGKSTLAVTGLLNGMDYVSDDYLILEQEGENLFAHPIYSIIALSPKMYNNLYDALSGCRFVSNNARKDKYIINIAKFHNKFRKRYPVKVCFFPEIVSDETPSVTECSIQERGQAITHLAHSTIIQMYGARRDFSVIRKLIGMVKNFAFYKIRLSRNIHANAQCLKNFLITLKNEEKND